MTSYSLKTMAELNSKLFAKLIKTESGKYTAIAYKYVHRLKNVQILLMNDNDDLQRLTKRG